MTNNDTISATDKSNRHVRSWRSVLPECERRVARHFTALLAAIAMTICAAALYCDMRRPMWMDERYTLHIA